MCGIVGYVGPQDARDVVLEGLRRLEYRGYDSAGIAVVADGRLSSAKKAGKLANLEKVLAEQPLPAATVGIGHTRWATHGGPTDRNAHPHLSADGSVAVIHNGIIENFAALRAECEATGVEFRSETDTEVAAHLLAAAYAEVPEGPGRLAEAMRVDLPPPRGRLHPGRHRGDGAGHAGRRPPQQPPGGRRRRRRVLPRLRRRRVHRAHPRGPRARPGPGRGDRPRTAALTVTDFAGSPVEPKAYTVDWDAEAAEKGGYDWFMLKEIAEQPQAIADTLLGRLGSQGAAGAGRGAPLRPGAARHRQDLRRRLRHGLPRRDDREVRHRALDPHPGRGRAGQRVPLPRPGARPLHAGRRHQPVRRDDGHPHGAAPRQGAARPRAGDLQRQRLDDPARVRRRPLHARRAGGGGRLHQGLPHPGRRLLPGRAVPRPGARHEVRGRGLGHRRRPPPAARGRRRGARRHGAGARAGPLPGRREHDPLPRPPRRVPGGAGGGPEAQGARLHPRRGLRGRRAQARPDRGRSTRGRR